MVPARIQPLLVSHRLKNRADLPIADCYEVTQLHISNTSGVDPGDKIIQEIPERIGQRERRRYGPVKTIGPPVVRIIRDGLAGPEHGGNRRSN